MFLFITHGIGSDKLLHPCGPQDTDVLEILFQPLPSLRSYYQFPTI